MALPPETGSACDSLNPFSRWADYAAIAQYADNIVPMAYDSFFANRLCASTSSYGGWVRTAANYAIESVSGKRAAVLMGVPNGRVLEPLNDALDSLRTIYSSAFQGISVFVYAIGNEHVAALDWTAIDSWLGAEKRTILYSPRSRFLSGILQFLSQ